MTPTPDQLELARDLTFAAGESDRQGIRDAVGKGAAVNQPDKFGHVALLEAITSNKVMKYPEKTVELLIQLGADVNLQDDRGNLPLVQAAWRGRDVIVQALLAAGAVVDTKDGRGETALFMAAQLGKVRVIDILIAAGADLNLPNDDGDTPLHVGISRLEVARMLVEAGAAKDINNRKGLTALKMARAQAQRSGAEGKAIASCLEGKAAETPSGWMVVERWDDWSIASPEVSAQREKITRVIESLKTDQLASRSLPFGGSLVYGRRENAEKIGALLKQAGCHRVDVDAVRFDPSKNEWIAVTARSDAVHDRKAPTLSSSPRLPKPVTPPPRWWQLWKKTKPR